MHARPNAKATALVLIGLMTSVGCSHTVRRSLTQEGASLGRAPGVGISGFTTRGEEERMIHGYALSRSDSIVVYSRVKMFDPIRGTWADSIDFTRTLPRSEVATLSHREFHFGKTALFVVGSVLVILVPLAATAGSTQGNW